MKAEIDMNFPNKTETQANSRIFLLITVWRIPWSDIRE